MATLRIKAPDGKTLAIPVADGTDPSQYDSIVDDVMQHYMQSTNDAAHAKGIQGPNENADTFERGENYPNDMATMGSPSLDVAMAVDAAPKLAMAAPKLIKAVPGVVRGIGEAASDIPGAVADVGSKIAELGSKAKGALQGGWDALTGNTPRGFGYAQGAGATPEARSLAKEAISMANEPQEELGNLVARSQAPANALPPAGGEAAIPAPEEFQTPIRQGILSGKEEMLNAAEAQRKQVGEAIENVLKKYDSNGTFYDPTAYNNQIKSMLLRDANGEVMTTGAQGQINEAIKEAAASMGDFAKDGPIKWSDAAKVKTLMQGNGRWGQAGLSRAQEAYNTAATLLKEDIDKQAMEMLQKQGGNVQDYQQLRDAYSKLSSLSESLNVAAKRQFANSAIPWWVKMAGGSILAGKAMGVVKGLTGH